MMNATKLKNKQRSFARMQDVSATAKILLIVVAVLLLIAPKWLPPVLGFALDVGTLVTYAIAVLALVASAYATMQTYYLKNQDRLRAINAAKFTLSSDTAEILKEYANLKKAISELEPKRKDLWNQILDEFALIEARVERKQDRLGILSANLAPELFPTIQDLYLSMLKLTSKRAKYYIRTDDLAIASQQQDNNKKAMIEEMDSAEGSIISKYANLQEAIDGMQDLPEAK